MSSNSSPVPVTFAHHWLVSMRGGEKVLEALLRLYPHAPVYTLVARRDRLSPALQRHPIHTSFLQQLPGGPRYYKEALPLHPLCWSLMRIPAGTQLHISSDASMAKLLPLPEGVPHVCYCHSPPRYFWDQQEAYFASANWRDRAKRAALARLTPWLRDLDARAAQRVTHFIANSRFVARRIRDYYQRESEVLYPPVAVEDFTVTPDHDGYYCAISQVTTYKKVDLLVDAFARLPYRLKVVGDGPDLTTLRRRATPNVELLGPLPFAQLREVLQRSRAFIFPQVEDFGITAAEAQAAGKPVIAYRAGGALDILQEGSTGLFFNEQTPECLAETIAAFEAMGDPFNPETCRRNAERFSLAHFLEGFAGLMERWGLPCGHPLPN